VYNKGTKKTTSTAYEEITENEINTKKVLQQEKRLTFKYAKSPSARKKLIKELNTRKPLLRGVQQRHDKNQQAPPEITENEINTKRDFDDVYNKRTRGEVPQVVIRYTLFQNL